MNNKTMVERWKNLPAYQELLRQVHLDMHVGLKNGASVEEVQDALEDLSIEICRSVDFSLMNGSRYYGVYENKNQTNRVA